MKLRSFNLIFIGLMVLILQSACTPWVKIKQVSANQWMNLNSGSSIGQTFVADNAGLQAVQLFLAPDTVGDGSLTFHLRSDPTSTSDLKIVRLPLQEITGNRYYRFDFPYVSDSTEEYYYLFLEIDGAGSVQVGNGSADSSLNGAAYVDHQPVEAQLSFKLDYDRPAACLEIFRRFIPWLVDILIMLIVFTIPGLALLSLVWSGWTDLYWSIKLVLSVGVSYTIYILIVLYSAVFHLQLGIWYELLPVIAGAIVIFWRNQQNLQKTSTKCVINFHLKQSVTRSSFWPDLALVIILVTLFLIRVWQMRGLEAPMWGDSVQHTAIVQLLMDHQGLFESWLPYTPYKTFSMHFGFPLAAALLAWVTRITSGQAVLLAGQFLSVLAALALYPLAVRLANGNRWAGVFAVLAAGLLSPMPAFYINWGRYAQLAGQVILPILLWMVWDVLASTAASSGPTWHASFPWLKIFLTGMTLTAMVLCQFRMPYLFMAFLLAWIIGWMITHRKLETAAPIRVLLPLLVIGLIGIVLFIPWAIRLNHGNLLGVAGMRAEQARLIEIIQQNYLGWKKIVFYVPVAMLVLTCFGWMWALVKKAWLVVSIGLWIAFMASIYSLTIIGVPGTQFVDPFSVLIALYIPVGLLSGYLVSDFANLLARWKFGNFVTVIFIALLGVIGAWNQHNIALPDTYAMVTRPDSMAMEWIREHTQANSRFLVEGFRAYSNTSIAGADAGWWIPILAQRENSMPPQYALTDEVPIVMGYSQKLVDLVAQLEHTSLTTDAGVKLLCDYGITHVYIGQKQGMVGNNRKPLFTPEIFENNLFFQQEYHQDRVYIFSLNEATCGQ